MGDNVYTVTVETNGIENQITFGDKVEMNKYLEGFEAITKSGDVITLDKSTTKIIKFSKQ